MRNPFARPRPNETPVEIPVPPPEMRALVGPTDVAAFDNPDGRLVYPYLAPASYRSVFDFGCGCGRVARQLMMQNERPERYLGIDIHAGMIRWCQANLTPLAPEFEFQHHDVYDDNFNPGATLGNKAPFPVGDGEFTLMNAISVFTHLTEDQVPHYLNEAARILADDGVLHASFLLLDKREFPFMQAHANALYVSWEHPAAAVVLDKNWVVQLAADTGLTVTAVHPPPVRGYQWLLEMRHTRQGLEAVEIPADTAPIGAHVIPPMPVEAHKIGLSS